MYLILATLLLFLNRFQRARSALVLDMDLWCFSTLRDFQTVDLAKTGDTERKQILVEYTLRSEERSRQRHSLRI